MIFNRSTYNVTFKVLTFLLIIGLWSCEHVIDLELPEDKKLVLISNFTPEENIKIHLGTTSNVNQDGIILPDKEAIVTLFKNGSKIDILEYVAGDGDKSPYFISKFKPTLVDEYSVTASYKDYPEVRSSDIIPSYIEISNTTLLNKDIFENYSNNYSYDLNVELEISKEYKNMDFFHIRLLNDYDFYYLQNSDTIKHFVFPQEISFELADQSLDHISLLHEPGILIDRNSLPDPSKIELNFFVSNLPGATMKGNFPIQIRSGSSNYYKFHKSVGEQEVTSADANNIFSIPSTLIFNNIENGIGNFSGYSSHIVDIKLK